MIFLPNYYKILDISPKASCNDVRKAYIGLAKLWHPDKNNDTELKFKDINEAYCNLKDSLKREEYDKQLEIQETLLSFFVCVEPELIVKEVRVSMSEVYNMRLKRFEIEVRRKGVLMNEILCIDLCNYKDEYLFEGAGNENWFDKRGDILLKLRIDPVDDVMIDMFESKYNLLMTYKVSLYTYYCEKSVTIDMFGRKIDIDYNNSLRCKILQGEGLPYYSKYRVLRGVLFVSFVLSVPDNINLTDENTNMLKCLFA